MKIKEVVIHPNQVPQHKDVRKRFKKGNNRSEPHLFVIGNCLVLEAAILLSSQLKGSWDPGVGCSHP